MMDDHKLKELQQVYPCVALTRVESYWTTPARLVFPFLSYPYRFPDTFKGTPPNPRYQGTFLFPPHGQPSALVAAALKRANDVFGDASVRFPWRDQGEKEHLAGYQKGGMYFTAKSGSQPTCLDKDYIACSPDAFYSGCWVRARVSLFHFRAGRDMLGVSTLLEAVQFLADDVNLAEAHSRRTLKFGEDGHTVAFTTSNAGALSVDLSQGGDQMGFGLTSEETEQLRKFLGK